MADQAPAGREGEGDEFLDESPFRSSLRTVLVVDLAVLSLWTAWAHPGARGLSRLALVAVWSLPALWNLVTRPMLRKLAKRRMQRDRREQAFIVVCVMVVTAMLTLSAALSDSVARSARTAVDRQFGSVDEMILAGTPDVRLAAQSRLDQVLNERSDTVNDLSLLVRSQFGFVVADTVFRNAGRRAAVERRVHVLEMDVQAASGFGDDPEATGLANRRNPGEGHLFLGPYAADALGVGAGDTVTMADPGTGDRTFVVDAVLPKRGFGVVPLDGPDPSNIAIVGTGAITTQASPPPLSYVIAIANHEGSKSSTAVTERLDRAFAAKPATDSVDGQALPAVDVTVDNVKAQILQQAAARTQPLSRLLRTLAMLFSLGAGLLLVTLFYGLAVARTSEVGALRSVGLRRRDAVAAFGVEGWWYAIAGSSVGALAGFGAAVLALRRGIAQSAPVVVDSGPQLRTMWIGLAAGFVLSSAAIAASMLLSTRGTIQRSAAAAGESARTAARSRSATAALGGVAVIGAMLVLRSLDSTGSFGFLAGLLAVAGGLAPIAARSRVPNPAVSPLRSPIARSLVASAAFGLAAWFPVALPGWFRHTGVGTNVLYAVVLLLVGAFLARSIGSRVAFPKRSVTTAGVRRAAKTLANASPNVAPNRDTLLRGAIAALVMALTTMSLLRVGLRDETVVRLKAAKGGWETVAAVADLSSIPEIVRAMGLAGLTTAVASLNVEVESGSGATVRVVASAVDGSYTLRRPAALTSRAVGVPTDRAVFDLLTAEEGTVVADQNLFGDGGTRLHRVEVGETLSVRDLRTGVTRSLTVVGVARGLNGFGGLVMGVSSASALHRGAPPADRLLVSVADPDSDDGEVVRDALARPGVTREDWSATSPGSAEAFSVVHSVAWLMWVGGMLVVGALSVLMVRSVRDRRQDWSVLRSLGMSTPEIRRIAASECLRLLAPSVGVGWLVGLVIAWRLVWAGSLGVDAGLPFSVVPLAGAFAVIVVPLFAVHRHLRGALANDAPLLRDR